jgi:hypothetical protein
MKASVPTAACTKTPPFFTTASAKVIAKKTTFALLDPNFFRKRNMTSVRLRIKMATRKYQICKLTSIRNKGNMYENKIRVRLTIQRH